MVSFTVMPSSKVTLRKLSRERTIPRAICGAKIPVWGIRESHQTDFNTIMVVFNNLTFTVLFSKTQKGAVPSPNRG